MALHSDLLDQLHQLHREEGKQLRTAFGGYCTQTGYVRPSTLPFTFAEASQDPLLGTTTITAILRLLCTEGMAQDTAMAVGESH